MVSNNNTIQVTPLNTKCIGYDYTNIGRFTYTITSTEYSVLYCISKLKLLIQLLCSDLVKKKKLALIRKSIYI